MAEKSGKPASLKARKAVREVLKNNMNFKRTSENYEIPILPSSLCQVIDINCSLTGNSEIPQFNMDDFPQRSLYNAIEYIESCIGLETDKFLIRCTSQSSDPLKKIEEHGQIFDSLRSKFDDRISIIADPFDVALNPNKTWGIFHDNNSLDMPATEEVLKQIASIYSSGGVNYVLTLGRIENEADITKRHVKDSRIASFSTNYETTNAYIYLGDSFEFTETGQKIKIGNIHEKLLSAICDCYYGTDLLIIKPSENYHIITQMGFLLSEYKHLDRFLSSPQVKTILGYNSRLDLLIKNFTAEVFEEKFKNLKIAAYTISGTYWQDMQILKKKGGDFLAAVLYERFSNILGAGVLFDSTKNILIIDRNVKFYLENKRI